MKRPKIGGLVTKDPSSDLYWESPDTLPVVAVFDTTDEDWGEWGESAVAQADCDHDAGKKGDWYVVVQNPEHLGEFWSLASYEIKHVWDFNRQVDRFRFICRWLLDNDVKPTPIVLESFEASFVSRRSTNIALSHGKFTTIRREEFIRAGWKKEGDDIYAAEGKWVKPG